MGGWKAGRDKVKGIIDIILYERFTPCTMVQMMDDAGLSRVSSRVFLQQWQLSLANSDITM